MRAEASSTPNPTIQFGERFTVPAHRDIDPVSFYNRNGFQARSGVASEKASKALRRIRTTNRPRRTGESKSRSLGIFLKEAVRGISACAGLCWFGPLGFDARPVLKVSERFAVASGSTGSHRGSAKAQVRSPRERFRGSRAWAVTWGCILFPDTNPLLSGCPSVLRGRR
jgi:hypothetical protein